MVGGIFYEHGHRMVATFVGFLTTILALWLWRKESRRWVRNLGFIALGSVIVQGLLGGLTVIFLLPTPISVSHATLAQSFFTLVASIALFTSRWWKDTTSPQTASHPEGRLLTLALCTAGAIFIQLILGAVMRHTQSGLVVPDFPLAYGQVFPSLSPSNLEAYNQQLIDQDLLLGADGPITSFQILIHIAHRYWAVIVSVMILWTSIRLFQLSEASRRLSFFASTLSILLLVQITLGALTVLTGKSVAITTAHVATGALLLMASVLASLHVYKLFGRPSSQIELTLGTREATA